MDNNNQGYNRQDDRSDRSAWSGTHRPAQYVSPFLWDSEKRNLKKLSLFSAGSILLYILFSSFFTLGFTVLTHILSRVYDASSYDKFAMLINSSEMQSCINALYSVFMVGLPFLIIRRFMKKKGFAAPIPMGKPRKPKHLPVIIFGAFGVCLMGNIVTSYFSMMVDVLFGIELKSPEMTLSHDPLGIFMLLLGSAIVPALIEEIALRGVIMQPLRRYGDMFAIIASSAVFGLLHCNAIQIPFAMMAGMAIGYAAWATDSVWTGVIIHFMNNAFSVVLSLILDSYGVDSVAYRIANAAFYAFILIGLGCVYLYFRVLSPPRLTGYCNINKGRHIIPPLFYGDSAVVAKKDIYKIFFLNMPMIIAFIAVVAETIGTFTMS